MGKMNKTTLTEQQKHFLRFVYYMCKKYGTESWQPIWKGLTDQLSFIYYIKIRGIIKRGYYNDTEKRMLARIKKHFSKQLNEKYTRTETELHTPFDYYTYGYPYIITEPILNQKKYRMWFKPEFDKFNSRTQIEDLIELGSLIKEDEDSNLFRGDGITINNPLNPGV